MALDDAIARLARQIEATQREERVLVDPEQIATFRREGACDLHRVCRDFVASVNRKLAKPLLELSPEGYSPDSFRESAVNLFQISSQGRQMQIVFEATSPLTSTEKFAIPYISEGEVRTYNQSMLERFEIRTLSIFLCVEETRATWRFYDWRTLSTGPVDDKLFVALMEPLF